MQGLAGESNLENARRMQGLAGESNLENALRVQGLAGESNLENARRMQGLAGESNLENARRMQGLAAESNLENARRMQGLAGESNLENARRMQGLAATVQEELSKSHQRPCDDQPAAPYQPAPLQQVPQPSSSNSAQYLVMYDYNAADDDEVSMVEGDIIVDAEIIDEGWMVGRVKRTGQSGMLPANYVQLNN
ncbi:LIM and SH3 domain protein 1 isoform X2 [Nematostella vectensis]|uniref:LIM and SH3 domain protein 1 isoform X2 n=1 Tax=Nematostella vectensis TaxID=45351 RepID=UPI002076F75D|nr:LIM and SH3 domain protein 1 isoform X2 [Nematostella vectensis]